MGAIFLWCADLRVYYPISVLPEWLQRWRFAVPASHVFEGMRQVLRRTNSRAALLQRAGAERSVHDGRDGGLSRAIRYARGKRECCCRWASDRA